MEHSGPSAREIEQALRAKLDTLIPELLSGAVPDGPFWCAGSVDGEAGNSLKVNRRGGRIGCWTDFSQAEGSDQRGGDCLKLICVVKFGGWSKGKEEQSKAIAWAKSWLGWDSLSPDRLKTVKRDTEAARRAADVVAAKEAEGRRRSAIAMWNGAVPIAGTAAISYLEGRRIDLQALGRAPGSLRFLPECWCQIRSPTTRRKYPAMIACIIDLPGELLGVHRTYLDVSGGKGGPVTAVKVVRDPVTKKMRLAVPEDRALGLKLKSHKLSMGDYAGGCIPLWKGDCRKTLREIDAGVPVYVSEGIEDGLTIAQAKPGARVVAGVALANMGALELPPQAGPVIFIGQNDPIDGKAVAGFEGAIARQQEQAKAQLRPPPKIIWPEAQFKDFNDQLMGKVMA